jgi:hypothetical protein
VLRAAMPGVPYEAARGGTRDVATSDRDEPVRSGLQLPAQIRAWELGDDAIGVRTTSLRTR